jgi:hypothetical protein
VNGANADSNRRRTRILSAPANFSHIHGAVRIRTRDSIRGFRSCRARQRPVVTVEARSDDETLDAGVARERLERNRRAARAASLVEDMGDGFSREGPALLSVGESCVELVRAVLIQAA